MIFGLEEVVRTANQAVLSSVGRSLSDIEVIILKGAWERLDYDQIATQNQYSTSYVSNDIAPKLWRLLSSALGEKVRKSNFKEALKRYRESTIDSTQAGISLRERSYVHPLSVKDFRQFSSMGKRAIAHQADRNDRFVPDEHYIPRPSLEQRCIDIIQQPGSFLHIRSPRQMGKTSLAHSLLYQLSAQNYCAVYLNLELTDRHKHLVDISQFMRWLCLNISRELGITGNLDNYWDEEGLGAKVSCTTYLEEYLLPHLTVPLVLCLDAVDLLFSYPEIYADFLSLLRSWHVKTRGRRIWKNFHLIIVHSTDVNVHLNTRQSPCNVGILVNLPDFTMAQAQSLAKTFHLERSVEHIESLFAWVGGHPYLLSLAFAELANRREDSMAEVLAELPMNSGPYGAHLREHLLSLEKEEELAIAFKHVIQSPEGAVLKPIVAYNLHSMGLISLTSNVAQPRCQLYTHYFRSQFIHPFTNQKWADSP